MTDGQWQIALAVVGIIVAIWAAVKVTTVVRNRRVSQQQKTGKNSVSIQSGRDTTIR